MSDHTIQHVSDTALWVATFRAQETERPDALFRDPLAAQLVGERGQRIAAQMKDGGIVRSAVVLRTCMIDDFINAAIAEGVDTVLNLGSGLDTRPYRMDLPSTMRWVEVDYPHLQEFKAERLGPAQPKCVLESLSLDLAERPVRQALFSRLNAEAKRVLVLTEGVTPLLSNDAVGELADDLRQQDRFALWVLDYNSHTSRRGGFGRGLLRKQLKNAPIIFQPPEWKAFFAGHRWGVKEIRYYSEESVRRQRPFKFPWWLMLRVLFMSPARRRALRYAAGYAVLNPTA